MPMRKYISLILVFVLCLSLAGCGETAAQADLYLKYAGIVDALEAKDYNIAINQIANLILEEQKNNAEPRPAALELMCANSWYVRDPDGTNPPKELTVKSDGTCTIDGQAMTWLEISSDENHMSIVALENGQHKYVLYLNCENVTRPQLTLYTSGLAEWGYYNDEYIAKYYAHPMLPPMIVSWAQVGKTDELSEYFYIYDSLTCQINDCLFDLEIAETTDDSLLTVYAINNDGKTDKAYTLRLQDRDGTYVLILSEDGTDIEATYFNEKYGKDDTWTEAIYRKARAALQDHLNGWSIRVDDKSLTTNQSLAYIYDLFTQAADYKDSAEYLARFSSLPSQLVRINEIRVDQLDKESTNKKAQYFYNPDGTLACASGTDIIDSDGIYYTDYHYFTYDETGKYTTVRAGYNEENVSAVGTPEYDADGRLVSMTVQTSSQSYTSTFTYDDQGRVATADIYPGDYSGRQLTYTYGDDGKLTQKVLVTRNGYDTYTSDYTYSGNALEKIVETYTPKHGDNTYTTEYAFTSDAQGRPLSVVVTTTNPNYTHKSTTQVYEYEDYYFLDTTGLVDENN